MRVRQALFHATDTEVLREILYGLTTSGPATSCVPEGMIGINNDLTPYEYDPQKARDLLAEAGYADGLEIEFMYLANSTNNMLAELLQAMWGEVGVTLVLQPMESGALSTALNKGEHMICSAGTTFSLGEAGEGLYNMFSLESQGSSANRTYLTDTAVDELLQKIVVTSDAQERAQMVYDVQALIHAQAPMTTRLPSTPTRARVRIWKASTSACIPTTTLRPATSSKPLRKAKARSTYADCPGSPHMSIIARRNAFWRNTYSNVWSC